MAYRYYVPKKKAKGNLFDFRSIIYYDYHEVDELITRLNNEGYDCRQTWEGSLGSGNWICIAPDNNHYNFVIKEVYVNEWTSAHTIRRKMKLSKADLAELEREEVIER